MKKTFILQIIFVIVTIALLSLLWEFVLEEFFFADVDEGIDEKIEYVLTTITFSLLALVYPMLKGLLLISSWKELEKILVDQGLQLDRGDSQNITTLDSMKSILLGELHRRKKVEDVIESERQKFFNMLDQLPICFHLQADDYSVPFANKMFKERFGHPDSGNCYQLMHNRSEPCEPCPNFEVFNSRKSESSLWTAKDGRNYLTVATPFEETNDSTLLMEMSIDVSSEQKAKEELRQALDEQEERVIKRTLELQRSNTALKEFASFAAHDLKEPLRKIIVFGDRFQEVTDLPPGGKGMKYLEIMQQSAHRMNGLVDDLLQLSQIASQKTNFSPVDLNRVVAEIVEDLVPSYPDARKNISVQSLPVVEAEKTQMYQLFKNLLSNSLEYAKAEESVRISIKGEMDNLQNHLFTIQDNGIGFDEKYKGKIFKPFERLHGRSEYSGTGIGLAICKKVVEIHGGEIDVKSQKDVGTTFNIRLPKSRSSL
jgi:signal transduction histidine kinase